MNPVKDHYDHHLAPFYSWMLGDVDARINEQQHYFERNQIIPGQQKKALDLGCGPGIQSIALARLGFRVTAVDFSKLLVNELDARKGILPIQTVESDLIEFSARTSERYDVVICMGDTVTHLADPHMLAGWIKNVYTLLEPDGKFVLSWRDLSQELIGENRFIPVRSDHTRIHTCFLEYFSDHVMVYDILNELKNDTWTQRVSSYPKLKIKVALMKDCLTQAMLSVTEEEIIKGMNYLVAERMS